MALEAFLALGMFATAIVALLAGYSVALTLGGVALIFALIGLSLGVFPQSLLENLPSRIQGGAIMQNETLVAVPLFILMGVILERSKVAEDLLHIASRLLGRINGGLGYAVVLVGALLAASTGIVGATVITMTLIALPSMLQQKYDPRLATGTSAASGTLGQIIPPSTVLIFMGDMLSSINAQVQMEQGNFAPVPVTVGDLFAGAFIPGLMLVGLYICFMIYKAITEPESCPATPMTEEDRKGIVKDVVVALVPPLLLILLVLGSILTGIATPTEAGSVGAVGATILAALRWRLSFRVLRDAAMATATITSMIFIILFGASVFSIVFRVMGGDNLVHEFLANLPGGAIGAMIVVMLIMFVLGFILDTFEIIFIIIPITAPILLALGIDPIWLGVMVGVNLQTSFMTPPFGFSLFYLRGVAPSRVTTGMIYRGALPFVGLQILAIALLFIFPQLITWLPSVN